MNLKKLSIVIILVIALSSFIISCGKEDGKDVSKGNDNTENQKENGSVDKAESVNPDEKVEESTSDESESRSDSDEPRSAEEVAKLEHLKDMSRHERSLLKKDVVGDLRRDISKNRSLLETKDMNESSTEEPKEKIADDAQNDKAKLDFGKDVTDEELANYKAVISTKFGDISLEFYPESAPNHVRNFLKLASSGFYDGTTFHRVIPDFMIQGGDPNSKDDDPTNDGMGGPGYTIDAEFNKIHHDRGILSMARSQDPNSAGSQFFIMHKDAPFLDGKYSAFGHVTKGMDVVDKIVNVNRDPNDRPIEDVKMTVKVMKKD